MQSALIQFENALDKMNLPVHSTRKIGAVAIIFFFLSMAFVAAPHMGSASTTTTGLIVPLYTYPTDSSWQTLIQQKLANPNVPVAAIVNPSSGPGSGQDPNFVSGINSLRSAGITVLGYVATGYGSNSISSVEAQINDYKQWYNVNGILFDEMSSTPGYETYYSTLSSYAYSLGFSWTVGNPGAPVPSSFIGTVGTFVIYENAGLPSLSLLASSTGGYPTSNFAFVSYGVSGSSVSQSYVSGASSYVSWMYVTDANLPNPYDTLPSYLSTLMSYLSVASETQTSTTSTQSSSQSATLTVQAMDQSGATVNGLFTVVQSSSGTVLDTGYTPLTYGITTGTQYLVTADSYGNYVFNHWSTGSTSATISITPSQSTSLIAYYQNSQITTTTTTSTTTTSTTPQTVPVTINTADGTGAPINGLFTVVQSSSGTILSTGFSPMTYYAKYGVQYTFTVDDYGSYTFSHWSNGATSRSITITPTQSTTLTAYFQSTTQANPTITIESSLSNGAQLTGMFTIVESSSNSVLAQGYTTLTYQGTLGSTYTVAVADYGSHHFIEWSNGSTNRFLTLSLTQSVTLVAYFT